MTDTIQHVCPVHGIQPTPEQQTQYLDDENVRHYDGRCDTMCAVHYDHYMLGANYTRADVEAYQRYCWAEEDHYLADPDCICTPSER